MKQLDNIFVILVLALVCAILPVSVMMFIGFAMMIGHCYAVGPEVAGFMLVLILFMMILFIRFSGSQNLTLILTPLSFGFSVPTLLPLGAGLLGSAVSALPAGCGVVIYYFIRFVHAQSAALSDQGTEIAEKLKLTRASLYNRSCFFERYLEDCSFICELEITPHSKIITSDDVFDFMLDLRSLYSGVDSPRDELFDEYLSLKHKI